VLFLALRDFAWVIFGRFHNSGKPQEPDFEARIFFVARAMGAALEDADFVVEALDEAERDLVF
jgi:hypothetical protein